VVNVVNVVKVVNVVLPIIRYAKNRGQELSFIHLCSFLYNGVQKT